MRIQHAVLATAIGLSLIGCDKRGNQGAAPATGSRDSAPAPQAQLGDLSTSLAAIRAEFNAHKGEARFLTLLSPT